jgi:hypothetical protein
MKQPQVSRSHLEGIVMRWTLPRSRSLRFGLALVIASLAAIVIVPKVWAYFATPFIKFERPEVFVGEGGGTVKLTVTLSQSSLDTVTVQCPPSRNVRRFSSLIG